MTMVSNSARPAFPKTGTRRWTVTDVVFKAALVALLLFALTHRDWPRFADKAMVARAVAYPLLVAIVPLTWWRMRLSDRHDGHLPATYPSKIAFLVTAPFTVDVAGNALDLYDRVDSFDDFCHFFNWAMLTAAIGIALLRCQPLPPWTVLALCIGFGATTAVLWEIGEYGAFITNTPERFTLYRDTIGDLALGLAGSTLAGLLCWLAARRRAVPPLGQATAC